MHLTQLKRWVTSLILPLLFAMTATAQERTVTGAIVDQSTGQPLSGVTVMVKGDPKSAVTTDNSGAFTLHTRSSKATIQFTYVGFESSDYKLTSDTNPIRIVLKKLDKSLDEV